MPAARPTGRSCWPRASQIQRLLRRRFNRGSEPARQTTKTASGKLIAYSRARSLRGRRRTRPVGSQFPTAPQLQSFSPPSLRRPTSDRTPGLRPDSDSFLSETPGAILRHTGSAQSQGCTSSLCSRLLPKPQRAGDRRAGTAPAARDLRSDEDQAQVHTSRSRVLGCAVPVLASLERHPGDRQAGHHDSLAPQGLSSLLAVDLEAWSWAAANL